MPNNFSSLFDSLMQREFHMEREYEIPSVNCLLW